MSARSVGLSRDTEIGKSVDVELVRDGRTRTVTFELGELSNDADDEDSDLPETESTLTENPLGVDLWRSLRPIGGATASRRIQDGVLVRSVSPRGPSFGKLRKGDVVTEMAFQRVTSPEEALRAMDEASGREGQPLLLRVYRQARPCFRPSISRCVASLIAPDDLTVRIALK